MDEAEGIDAVNALNRIARNKSYPGDYKIVLSSIVEGVMPDAVHPNGEIGARIQERLAVAVPHLHRLVAHACGESFMTCLDGLDPTSASSHTLLDAFAEVCAFLEERAGLIRWAAILGQETVRWKRAQDAGDHIVAKSAADYMVGLIARVALAMPEAQKAP